MIKKLERFIAKILPKRHIKVLLIVFVVLGLFSNYVFADGPALINPDVESTIKVVYKALSILSWGWIVLANLAGKLMTNDVVYGTFLHLDSTLWTLWNVAKNISNFLLGFLVLYSILRNTVSAVGFEAKKKPLDIIKNTLMAGILIQMSRFLVGIVLDVSTVCTAAIGSFPAQFLAASDEFKMSFKRNNLEELVQNKIVIDYTNEDPITIVPIESENELTDEDINSFIDILLPSTDSLSGPLIYIGMNVFDFRNYNIQRVDELGSWKELFLSIGLNGLLLLAYSVMMLLLFIFNLMRVIILWIAIPMMPLIILASVFGFTQKNFLGEIINIKNLLKLVFKPVILTGALSLVLIILVLIRGIISKNSVDVDLSDKNLIIHSMQQSDETYNSTMDIDGLLNVNMNGFKEGFADIIVYILGICLVYFVLKLSTVETGFKFIDTAMKDIFNRAESILTNAPIVPIPGGSPVSIATLKNKINSSDVLSKAVGINLSDQDAKIRKYLRLNDTYDSLNTNMTREEFINTAYDVSKASGITTYTMLLNNAEMNEKLQKKIDEWNIAKPNYQQIRPAQIFERSKNEEGNEQPK